MRRCPRCTSLAEAHRACPVCGDLPAELVPAKPRGRAPSGWAARRGPRGRELDDAETVRLAKEAGLLPASRRPNGVTLLAVPSFMLGNGLVLAGVLGLLQVGPIAEAVRPFAALGVSELASFAAVLAAGLTVSGFSAGLLVGARWAWWAALVWYVATVLASAVGLLAGALASGLGLLLGVLATACLLTLRSRIFFALGQPAQAA